MEKPTIMPVPEKAYTVYRYTSLDSTNDYLKQEQHLFDPFSVVLADEQRRGRGRFSRQWRAAAGKDLTFSLLLPLADLEQPLWPNITQIAALSIAETLEPFGLHASIKWPNDLLVNQRKICGILCETTGRGASSVAVLGIGLNVNSDASSLSGLPIPATSLRIESGAAVPREALLFSLLDAIVRNFRELTLRGFAPFCDTIRQRLAWLGEETTVIDGETIIKGRIRGINPDGTLLFARADGTATSLHSGELSFRKE